MVSALDSWSKDLGFSTDRSHSAVFMREKNNNNEKQQQQKLIFCQDVHLLHHEKDVKVISYK